MTTTDLRPAGAATPAPHLAGKDQLAGDLSHPCHEQALRVPAGRTRLLAIALLGYAVLMAPAFLDDAAFLAATRTLLIGACLVHLAATVGETSSSTRSTP